MLKKISALLAAVFAASLVSVTPASADGNVVSCGRSGGGFGLYYNSNNNGSRTCIYGNVRDYDYDDNHCSSQGCPAYYFEVDGRNGQGQRLKNAAASVYNYDDGSPYKVCYNAGWGGSADFWTPYGQSAGSQFWYGNLNHTFNNNASQFRLYGS
ncbi:hypothetical protein ACIHFE_32755 [Streptomyces sp. NPDC052396]|uniref:hypothetical protein n=1 Tax=Streptomyces sp. NPDC052396 TaxID=3365689 RepID=UPI0037D8464C